MGLEVAQHAFVNEVYFCNETMSQMSAKVRINT